MKTFRADLHVHTVLSPCADIEMIPPLIVQTAVDKGIDLIAITDHNHTANINAVMNAAGGTNISVLPGMELQTKEEIHLLCLFDTLERALSLQSEVDKGLPDLQNDPHHFGEQFVVDENGDLIRSEERLLLSSVNISLNAAVDLVHQLGGLAIPAHVDRKAYGLLNILGFFPENIAFDAIEISRFTTPALVLANPSYPANTPIIQNGDVHRLEEFLANCIFMMETRNISEIHKAFSNIDGRSFRLATFIDKLR